MQLTKLAMIRFFSKLNHATIKITIISLAICMLWGAPVQAARWVNTAQESFNATSPGFGVPDGSRPIDPRQYVASIIQVILGFLGVIALLLIIYAGFSWMTAQGNKDKIEKAQQTLATSIIGLLIVLAAFSVTIFVTNALLRSTNRDANIIKQDPR